jgi:uncharacterized protein (DUF305 family)
MNKITVGMVALVIGLILGFGGAGAYFKSARNANEGMHVMPGGQMMHDMSGMQDEMDNMLGQLQGKTGDEFDKAFLSEMIMHHQGAVVMAEAALRNARHQEIKDMAREIIDAQAREINHMKEWQKNWYEE